MSSPQNEGLCLEGAFVGKIVRTPLGLPVQFEKKPGPVGFH